MCTVDQVLPKFQTPTTELQWKPDINMMSELRVVERYANGTTEPNKIQDIGDLIAKVIIG